jgi:hypothetical protein
MPEVSPSKYRVQAGWDDVPHLTEQAKREMLSSIPPHLRDARSKGIPSLGSGAIYPVSEDRFVIEPFDIPPYWPRAYGMDVGWNKTAAVWGAHDRESDRLFLYAEHYMGKTVPAIHTAAIKARGVWIPGVIDPASRGGSQADGETLLKEYKQQGLKLSLADNSVEAGLFDVWQRLETDRLKVFDSLRNWLVEYRMYRRDDNGKVVKQDDHLMDATRYLSLSGLKRAMTYAQHARMGVYDNTEIATY